MNSPMVLLGLVIVTVFFGVMVMTSSPQVDFIQQLNAGVAKCQAATGKVCAVTVLPEDEIDIGRFQP